MLSFYISIYIQVFNPAASWFGDLTTFTLSATSLSSNSKLFTASNAKIATTDCHPIHLLLLTSWQHLNLATPLCQVHQQDNGCSKRFSCSHSCFMPSPNESLEMGNLIYLPSCKSQTEVSEKMFLRYRMNLGRYEHETKKSNKSFPDKRDESHQYFMP